MPSAQPVRGIMFETLMHLTIVLSFCFPAVPWLFGARWGRKGVWFSTGFVALILLSFLPLFWIACIAANCGQGAVAIFVLGPIWFFSGLVTAMSAAFAYYKFVR
jgi:hypothetical protein